MGYSKLFKERILKHIDKGITPIEHIAIIRRVPRQTIYRWLRLRKRFGSGALANRRPGAKKSRINVTDEKLILAIWNSRNKGVHKMHLEFKKFGRNLSERQIQKVYRIHNLRMNKRKRPSQIKFVKYEWPNPNDLWHTDWTTCPYTGKQLIAFIDDHSRFIVHAEFFDSPTAENTILAFENAIKKYGKPKNILTDNGTQFTSARKDAGLSSFTKFCNSIGVKHILGRVHHPQTNGKIERWFGTYKSSEHRDDDSLDSFIKYYNQERFHQGIGYLVPLQRYKCNINAV